MKRSDLLGIEFDWFAIDSIGSVALMASAGHGPIPDFVFAHFDAQQAIATRFAVLTGLSEGGDLIRSAQALAGMGIFAYDWQHWNGPYLRIECPPNPAPVNTLGFDPSLRDAFVRFSDLQFSALPKFQPQTLVPCSA